MKAKKIICFILIVAFSTFLTACSKDNNDRIDNSIVPQNIEKEENGNPILRVYNTSTKLIEETDIENYLLGVVAGEMYNSFELEALKAQAILARTYAMEFLNNHNSKYEGADISDDINEAQAYNRDNINDNIKKAVLETKGLIVTQNGDLIKAWFHANSGGVTTNSKNGLNYTSSDNFTESVTSPETENNSDNYSWGVVFKKTEILETLRKMKINVNNIQNIEIGDKDSSGRVKTFKFGDSIVNANEFRINIGSTKLKSTLITNIKVYANTVYFEGRGYGHGVGMSQWGANVLAKEGKNAEEIIKYYFKNVEITRAY